MEISQSCTIDLSRPFESSGNISLGEVPCDMGDTNYYSAEQMEEGWSVFLVGSLNSGAEKARLLLFHTDRDGGFNMFPGASLHIITLSVMVSLGSAYVTQLSTCLNGCQTAWELRATGLSCLRIEKATVLPGRSLQEPWLCSSQQSWVRAVPGGIFTCLKTSCLECFIVM